MKLQKALFLTPILLIFLVGTAVAKPPPRSGLDSSFGQGGKTLVAVPKSEDREDLRLAQAPSGKSYVLDEGLLLAFGANGRPDQGFGTNGRLRVSAASGATTSVADITVDSSGRILVVGSFEPTPGAVNQVLPVGGYAATRSRQPVSEAFVTRYLPNGERDGSFGANGEVDTTLEVPLPTAAQPWEGLHYEKPVVFGQRIAVVEGDQPVIGGSYIFSAEYCYSVNVPSFGFVARIGTSASGAQTLPSSAWTTVSAYGTSVLDSIPGDGLAVLGAVGNGCERRGEPEVGKATLLDAAGALSSANDPARPQFANLAATLGVDGRGRMLVLEGPGLTSLVPEKFSTGWKLIRLLPDADLDTSFGSQGGLPLPKFGTGPVRSVTVDSRGRALVGGGLKSFRLVRIGTKAKVDRSFGKEGWMEVGFGKGTSAELAATAFDRKERLLAVGRVTSGALKTGEGIGLARITTK